MIRKDRRGRSYWRNKSHLPKGFTKFQASEAFFWKRAKSVWNASNYWSGFNHIRCLSTRVFLLDIYVCNTHITYPSYVLVRGVACRYPMYSFNSKKARASQGQIAAQRWWIDLAYLISPQSSVPTCMPQVPHYSSIRHLRSWQQRDICCSLVMHSPCRTFQEN